MSTTQVPEPPRTDSRHFEWQGVPLRTWGEMFLAASDAVNDGKATEFLTAYRAHSEYADINLGYLIGYAEPAAWRAELREAFDLDHPILGGRP